MAGVELSIVCSSENLKVTEQFEVLYESISEDQFNLPPSLK